MRYYNNYGISNPVNMFQQLGGNLLNKTISKMVSMSSETIKNRYGYEFVIRRSRFGKGGIEMVNNWIKDHDPKYKDRVDSVNPILNNTQYMFNLDENTYCLVVAGKASYDDLDVLRTMMGDRNTSSQMSEDDIYLYIFGKKAFGYKKEVENILSKISEGLYVYNVSGASGEYGGDREEFNSIVSEMHQRQMDTLFFNPGVKEEITKHIDDFLAIESVYKERDLRYKTGIMMYGSPGTGKSSLANAIATKYKCSLIIIDMNTFARLDTIALSQSINADNDRYIILLEDIDCIFNSLNRVGEDGTSESADKEEKKVINKLLQFLDSNNSPTNVIFLATTNHFDRLDKLLDQAILRAGRFDIKVAIEAIDRPVAEEMCRSFKLSEDKISEIMSTIQQGDGFPVNQSWLQKMILSSIEGKILNKEEENNEEFEN